MSGNGYPQHAWPQQQQAAQQQQLYNSYPQLQAQQLAAAGGQQLRTMQGAGGVPGQMQYLNNPALAGRLPTMMPAGTGVPGHPQAAARPGVPGYQGYPYAQGYAGMGVSEVADQAGMSVVQAHLWADMCPCACSC